MKARQGSARKSKTKATAPSRAGKPRTKPAATSTHERASGDRASQLIDQRIRELDDWRGETLARMRALILEADPGMTEEWKWMGTPVWSHDGIVCTGESYKEVVKLTFARGASVPDPAGLFNSSLEGNTRRAIDIREGEKVDARAFRALVKAAVARNQAPEKKAKPSDSKVKSTANDARATAGKAKPPANKAKPRASTAKPGASRAKPGGSRAKPGGSNERPVKLLSGGNPQIAKADGDAPVQAYIAAMPGWKSALGKRLDALIVRHVPEVKKAVKWNSPFYGIEGKGWFLSFHTFTNYVKVTFFRGRSLQPVPPGPSKTEETRYLDIREDDKLDEAQLAAWVKQAAALPGWVP